MATKKGFFPYGSLVIMVGSEIRFWMDKWLGNTILHEQWLALYNLYVTKAIQSLRCQRPSHQM
jgi:hypothetical protein